MFAIFKRVMPTKTFFQKEVNKAFEKPVFKIIVERYKRINLLTR
jgi:hypothetical protein